MKKENTNRQLKIILMLLAFILITSLSVSSATNVFDQGAVEVSTLLDTADGSNFFDLSNCGTTATVTGIDSSGAVTCSAITGAPAVGGNANACSNDGTCDMTNAAISGMITSGYLPIHSLFYGGLQVGYMYNNLYRATSVFTVTSGTGTVSSALFDGKSETSGIIFYPADVSANNAWVNVNFGGVRHYWNRLAISFSWGTSYAGSSSFLIQKYEDTNYDSTCDTWTTVADVTGFSGAEYTTASGLGSWICQVKVTFRDVQGTQNYILFGELAMWESYYGDLGPYLNREGGTVYGNLGVGGAGTGSYNLDVTGTGRLTGALTAASFSGAGTGLTGTANSFTVGDLSCTNCIGGTEIDESTLTHDSLSGAGTVDTIGEWQTGCTDCVASGDVAFNYAGSASEGGAATDVSCTNCIVDSEVSDTLTASTATTSGNSNACSNDGTCEAQSVSSTGVVTASRHDSSGYGTGFSTAGFSYDSLNIWQTPRGGGCNDNQVAIGRNIYQDSSGAWQSNDMCCAHQAIIIKDNGYSFRYLAAVGGCSPGAASDPGEDALIGLNGGNSYFNIRGGNVGIGTSSLSYKLDVSGTGRFTSGLTSATLDTGSGAMDLGDATVANGDTNSIPTGDQVYDFVTGQGYITDDTSVPKNHLASTGTLGFTWSDAEVSDTLTASSATTTVATVTGTNSAELVRGNMADNDQFRILVSGTGSNAGYAEIATADDGTEPIYVRQYTGTFTSLTRTATLLDGSGNTAFPGSVTATSFSGAGTGLTGTAESLTSGSVSTPSGTYKHLGAWAVARTGAGAILVNTAYTSDYASTAYDLSCTNCVSDGEVSDTLTASYATSAGNADTCDSQHLGTGNSPTFAALTLSGALSAQGATYVTHLPWFNAANAGTGYIKLVTPIVHNEGNMFDIHIRGYGYNEAKNTDTHCYGYAYSATTLISYGCQSYGSSTYPIEIGTESRSGTTYVVIRIGTPSSTWYYNHFTADYVGWVAKSASGFSWVTGETTPTQTGNTHNVLIDDAAGTVDIRTASSTTTLKINATGTAYDATTGIAQFIDNSGRTIAIGGLGMFRRDNPGNADFRINYIGYNGGIDYYRDLDVYDGKNNLIMSVDGSAGRVGIKNSAPSYTLDVTGTIRATSFVYADGGLEVASGGNIHVVSGAIKQDNVNTATGTALVHNANGYYYDLSSSARYKENIRYNWTPTTEELQRFLKLKPAMWDYKNGMEINAVSFISEDLAELNITEENGRSVLTNYDNQSRPESNRDYTLIALQHLILQEHDKQIEQLKQENKMLKDEIASIRTMVVSLNNSISGMAVN